MNIWDNSTLSNNSARVGGAIWLDNGTVTVAHTVLTSNSATNTGGAIDNTGTGTLQVGQSTFSGNTPNTIGGPYTNEGGNIGL